MNRRDFLQGIIAVPAIISTVSTRTIVDLAKNTWRRPYSIVIDNECGEWLAPYHPLDVAAVYWMSTHG